MPPIILSSDFSTAANISRRTTLAAVPRSWSVQATASATVVPSEPRLTTRTAIEIGQTKQSAATAVPAAHWIALKRPDCGMMAVSANSWPHRLAVLRCANAPVGLTQRFFWFRCWSSSDQSGCVSGVSHRKDETLGFRTASTNLQLACKRFPQHLTTIAASKSFHVVIVTCALCIIS